MPWRAEPLYEIAKWHDSQIGNCSRVAACETQHHLMAYLHGKEVGPLAASPSSSAQSCCRVYPPACSLTPKAKRGMQQLVSCGTCRLHQTFGR
jgi:hypothetical protein